MYPPGALRAPVQVPAGSWEVGCARSLLPPRSKDTGWAVVVWMLPFSVTVGCVPAIADAHDADRCEAVLLGSLRALAAGYLER